MFEISGKVKNECVLTKQNGQMTSQEIEVRAFMCFTARLALPDFTHPGARLIIIREILLRYAKWADFGSHQTDCRIPN